MMGKIFFFLSLFFFSIFILWLLSKLRKEELRKKENREEKRWSENTDYFDNGTRTFMVIGIVLLLLFCIYYYFHNDSARTKQNAIKKNEVNEREVNKSPIIQNTNKPIHGSLSWDKEGMEVGLNPQVGVLPAIGVVIVRNDEEHMKFSTTNGDTNFVWNKRETYGRWDDTKGAFGRWNLEQTGEKSYEGEVSDNLDNFIKLSLKLD